MNGMANIGKSELSSKHVEKCFESALLELRKVLGDKVQIEINIDNMLAESLEQAFGLDASTGITELRNGNALMKIYSTDYLPFDTDKTANGNKTKITISSKYLETYKRICLNWPHITIRK